MTDIPSGRCFPYPRHHRSRCSSRSSPMMMTMTWVWSMIMIMAATTTTMIPSFLCNSLTTTSSFVGLVEAMPNPQIVSLANPKKNKKMKNMAEKNGLTTSSTTPPDDDNNNHDMEDVIESNPDYEAPSTTSEQLDDQTSSSPRPGGDANHYDKTINVYFRKDGVYFDNDSDDDDDYSDSDNDDEDDNNELDEEEDDKKEDHKKGIKDHEEKKSVGVVVKNTIQFVKENTLLIVIVLGALVFRKELWDLLFSSSAPNGIPRDRTGRKSSDPLSIIFSGRIFKLIIFVFVMKRVLMGSNGGDNDSSLDWILLFMKDNPLFGLLYLFLIDDLSDGKFNPAHVPDIDQHYAFERMNERYVKDGMALQKSLLCQHSDFTWPKAPKVPSSSTTTSSSLLSSFKSSSSKKKMPHGPVNSISANKIVIIMDWTGLDQEVSQMNFIRDQVSFLLSEYRTMALGKRPQVEIVVLLQSPGGSASSYGFAASQLLRLRNSPDMTLTVCVDTVAASGGYMLACCASEGQLIAAPFASVGSIGAIAQVLNYNDLLKKWDIQPLTFRAGKNKVPLTWLGEVTEEGKEKVQQDLTAVHSAFQRHVIDCRPRLEKNLDIVGTGDVWLGMDAIDLGLVDQLMTSDEYIGKKMEGGARVLKMVKVSTSFTPFGKVRRYSSLMSDDPTVDQRPFDLGVKAKRWIEKTLSRLVSIRSTSSIGVEAKAPVH